MGQQSKTSSYNQSKGEFPQPFGRYYLLSRAGQGGMAEVFRAVTQDSVSRIVIIKKTHSHLQFMREFRRMFQDEIRISALLNHSNIVHVNTYSPDGEFIEMEYVKGKTVYEMLSHTKEQNKPLPKVLALYVCHEIAKALAYAHSLVDPFTGRPLDIVHRDISPQNIMVGFDGTVRLFDFGVAQIRDKLDITESGAVKGKLSYMSPEQATPGAPIDNHSDIFSLGIVLWEMLNNQKIFPGISGIEHIEKLKREELPDPKLTFESLSDATCSLLNDMLNKAAAARPSAEQCQQRLSDIISRDNVFHSLPKLMKQWLHDNFEIERQKEEDELKKSLAEVFAIKQQNKVDHEAEITATIALKTSPATSLPEQNQGLQRNKVDSEDSQTAQPTKLLSFTKSLRLGSLALLLLILPVWFILQKPDSPSHVSNLSDQTIKAYVWIPNIKERNPTSHQADCNISLTYKSPQDSEALLIGEIRFQDFDTSLAVSSESLFKAICKKKLCQYGASLVVPEKNPFGTFLGAKVYSQTH